MNYEEALEHVKKLSVILDLSDEYYQAMCIAIESIGKQIAKKPRKVPSWSDDEETGELWEICPYCSNANILYPDHHCECGQRLDWSEFRYPEKELEKWKKKPTIEEFVGLEGYK